MNANRSVNLVSSDGVAFPVPVKVANLSKYVSMMTDEHFIDELNECKETEDIPVMRVSSHLLGIIVKFMHYYADDPMVTIEKPIVSDNLCDVVQKWYATFILQLDEEVLYDLVNASNYMHIQPLLELSCAAVAVQRYC
jgi:S-phase kinase-associated protein 1